MAVPGRDWEMFQMVLVGMEVFPRRLKCPRPEKVAFSNQIDLSPLVIPCCIPTFLSPSEQICRPQLVA